jgi:hypothetical protein
MVIFQSNLRKHLVIVSTLFSTLFSNKTTLAASEIIETNLITLLPYYLITLLLYYFITLLLYYFITLLLYCSSLFNKVIRLVF